VDALRHFALRVGLAFWHTLLGLLLTQSGHSHFGRVSSCMRIATATPADSTESDPEEICLDYREVPNSNRPGSVYYCPVFQGWGPKIKMKKRVRASHVSAGIFALFFCCAPCAPAHAACTVSDLGDAFQASLDGMKDLLSNGSCLAASSNLGFWIVTTAFSAATAASPQMHDACDAIQTVANYGVEGGEDIQKVHETLDKLPAAARDALNEVFGDVIDNVNSGAGELLPILSFASCACKVANSEGVAKTLDVGGTCFKDALCAVDEVITGRGCDSGPHGITTMDCIKGVYGGGMTPAPGGNGLYTDVQGTDINGHPIGFACFCPPPMKMGLSYTGDHPNCNDASGKPGPDMCQVCSCPYPTKMVALGVCLCPDGSALQANGECAPPCAGSCPAGQILKSAIRLSNGQCSSQCGCPAGQTMENGVCVLPPCPEGEARLPSGACCAKTMISACGECCLFGQAPDTATGTCVAAPAQSPIPPAPSNTPPDTTPQTPDAPPNPAPDAPPKPILHVLPRPMLKPPAPFSPVRW
jgi:hypothetical protein